VFAGGQFVRHIRVDNIDEVAVARRAACVRTGGDVACWRDGERGPFAPVPQLHGATRIAMAMLSDGVNAPSVDFGCALVTHSAIAALPFLLAAAFALSAQNPPLDAARLDIMPPLLWGRAEAVRTLLRSLAMALAPLLFGAVSDHVFGGGRSGLQWTFVVMILPLGASSWLLFKGLRTYPADVANAAASADDAPGYPQPTDHWGL